MTNLTRCSERESLVALVYEDGDLPERNRLEAHVLDCAECADELEQLRSTHIAMASWPVPEPKGPIVDRLALDQQPWRVVHAVAAADTPAAPARRFFAGPWAAAAAAVLVLSAAAGMANIEIKYGADGLTLRTGWGRTPDPIAATTTVSGAGVVPVASTTTPWRSDLAALERQLRTEFSAQAAADRAAAVRTAAPMSSAEAQALFRRLQQLIADSEQRQQRDLAYRVTQVMRDVEAQRRTDLVHIQQGFGRLESATGITAAQQREFMNYMMRVSQKQQ